MGSRSGKTPMFTQLQKVVELNELLLRVLELLIR